MTGIQHRILTPGASFQCLLWPLGSCPVLRPSWLIQPVEAASKSPQNCRCDTGLPLISTHPVVLTMKIDHPRFILKCFSTLGWQKKYAKRPKKRKIMFKKNSKRLKNSPLKIRFRTPAELVNLSFQSVGSGQKNSDKGLLTYSYNVNPGLLTPAF